MELMLLLIALPSVSLLDVFLVKFVNQYDQENQYDTNNHQCKVWEKHMYLVCHDTLCELLYLTISLKETETCMSINVHVQCK